MRAFFAPVNKKVREKYQGIERAKELEEGEPEELVEVGEKAGNENEGTDTERDTPEGEDEEEGEEKKKHTGTARRASGSMWIK